MMHSLCLAGNHYSLRFTVNALCNLEEKTGMSLAHLQETSFSCIRGLLWCALYGVFQLWLGFYHSTL